MGRKAIKARMPFEEALQLVESITDRLGMPVDRKIHSLVACLIMMGVRTTMSCGGHKRRARGHSHPWVRFDERDIALVTRIVAQQNRPVKENGRRNDNIWAILPSHQPSIVPFTTNKSLRAMQRNAEEFASRMQRMYRFKRTTS